jgi:hypothetical protein
MEQMCLRLFFERNTNGRMPLAKMSHGTKRSRTQQHDAAQAQPDLPGREQLLFTSPEMQTRLGQKYCDEAQLLPLLLAQGFVREFVRLK